MWGAVTEDQQGSKYHSPLMQPRAPLLFCSSPVWLPGGGGSLKLVLASRGKHYYSNPIKDIPWMDGTRLQIEGCAVAPRQEHLFTSYLKMERTL